jgi:hypothetical protein
MTALSLSGGHKLTIYKEILVDAKTGEETKIEFTDSELAEFEAKAAEQRLLSEQLQADLELKVEARSAAEAKLLALGLTTDDLKALLG